MHYADNNHPEIVIASKTHGRLVPTWLYICKMT